MGSCFLMTAVFFLAGDAVEHSTSEIRSNNPEDKSDEATPLEIASGDDEVDDYEEDGDHDKDKLDLQKEEQEPSDDDKELTAHQESEGEFSTSSTNFITSTSLSETLHTFFDWMYEALNTGQIVASKNQKVNTRSCV